MEATKNTKITELQVDSNCTTPTEVSTTSRKSEILKEKDGGHPPCSSNISFRKKVNDCLQLIAKLKDKMTEINSSSSGVRADTFVAQGNGGTLDKKPELTSRALEDKRRRDSVQKERGSRILNIRNWILLCLMLILCRICL